LQFQYRNRINAFASPVSTSSDIGIAFTGCIKDTAQLEFSSRKKKMTKVIDGTKVPHHGLFYMENAGGCGDEPVNAATDERQPGCFGLEEERGEDWKGSGAMKSAINESLPSL
jgi:hypothetical protein